MIKIPPLCLVFSMAVSSEITEMERDALFLLKEFRKNVFLDNFGDYEKQSQEINKNWDDFPLRQKILDVSKIKNCCDVKLFYRFINAFDFIKKTNAKIESIMIDSFYILEHLISKINKSEEVCGIYNYDSVDLR